MESIKQHDTSSQALDFFCKSSFSLKTKLALLTFHQVKYPIFIEKFILLLEYLQLMSQALSYENSDHNSYFTQIILYFLKLVNPSSLLSYKSSDRTTSTVLVMILCCTFLKLLLFSNVIFCSLKNREMHSWLLNLWRWIYKSQTRFLYFLFTSFWVKALIETNESNFTLFGMTKSQVLFLGSLVLALELILSFLLETQLCYFLETKDFLSSKNYHLQMTTLFQKFIIQLIFLISISDSEALIWIISTVGIVFDAVKFYFLIYELPLYNIKALSWQKSLLSAIISVNLANLMHIVLKNNGYMIGANLDFVIIIWILLALLINKISHEVLNFQSLSLLLTNDQKTVQLLLHKVSLSKQLQRTEKIPTSDTSNCDLSYLFLMHQRINIQEIFGLPELKLSSKTEIMKEVFLLFYRELSRKFPENSLVKLHYAEISFKQGESYSKTLKILNEVQKDKCWSNDYLGRSLLLYEIEKSIQNTQKQNLDFSTYIESRVLVKRLRDNILAQADLQICICNNMLNKTCDIEEIHSYAQKISHFKSLIQKKIDRLSRGLSEYYISPFLTFAEYHLAVNHSISDFRKYYEIYTQKYSKFKRIFKEPSLMQENIYQASNVLLLLSTEKNEYGKILYASNSLANLCGQRIYQGLNISTIFPQSLKGHFRNLLNQNCRAMHKINHAYLRNKDEGYIIEADFCLKYHPYLAQGLCLSMIIRPTPSFKNLEFLLLRENGDIEGASKELSKTLNLRKDNNSIISVKILSEQLYLVNNAFNRILDKKIESDKIAYKKALEIYSAFTSEDQEIQLYVLRERSHQAYQQQQRKSFKFSSQIQVLNYGDSKMKLVKLRAITENPSPESERNPPNPFTDKEDLPENFAEIEEYLKLECDRENFRARGEAPLQTVTSERKYFNLTNPDVMSTKGEASFYGSSQSSPVFKSAERAENKIFKLAILSKSYPRSFTSLCFIFYLIIFLTFASQLIMKSVSDSTMKDLQIRKNLLKYSEERSYKGGLLQMNGRGIVLVLRNFIETGGTYVNISTTVRNSQLRIRDMKQANGVMLDYVYSLDKATQNELFRKNVMINGTYYDSEDPIYKEINLFAAIEEFAAAVKALYALPDPSTLAGFSIGDYLRINLVDDFLYESARITDMLTKTVEEQKESFQYITNLFLILNPFLLTAIGVLLSSIIWNQQRIEKKNLKAFIKIPREGVQAVVDRLSEFKNSLLSQEPFIKKWASTTKKDIRTLHSIERTSAYSKKAEAQKVKYEAFRKRYYKYIVRVIACISILVVITIWDFVTTRQAIKVIYNRQNQLQFANYISSRVMVAQITYVELFVTNNTMKVEHQYPYEGLVRRSEILKEIQTDIPDKFLEVDGSYNPEVQSIIFEDNPECNGFTSDFIHYCQVLTTKGQPVNLLVAMAAFQNLMANKIKHYLKANKSTLETLIAEAYWGEAPITYCLTITEEAHRIANIMDESMTKKIGEMQDLKINIIVIFSVGLCLVSFLIWFYILRVIREVHNDFKKVLQIFPPNLVLSSFLIQKFLRETSNGFFWK